MDWVYEHRPKSWSGDVNGSCGIYPIIVYEHRPKSWSGDSHTSCHIYTHLFMSIVRNLGVETCDRIYRQAWIGFMSIVRNLGVETHRLHRLKYTQVVYEHRPKSWSGDSHTSCHIYTHLFMSIVRNLGVETQVLLRLHHTY